MQEAGIQGFGLGSMGTGANDGEVLDEMITRSRGEVKHTYSPRITSSSDCTTENVQMFNREKVQQLPNK